LDLHLVSNHESKSRRSGVKSAIDSTDLLGPLLSAKVKTAIAQLKPDVRSKFYRHVSRAIADFLRRAAPNR
jgi:hypothetical protein